MNTELRLNHTRIGSNKHGKSAKDISFTDLVNILAWHKQHQEAMFLARKQHAKGTYHSKQRHGLLLLNALNKTPLLNISQKGTKDMMEPM